MTTTNENEVERMPEGSAPASAEQRDGNRTKHFVTEISTHAKLQLGEMRDQIDDIVRAIDAREKSIIDVIEEHIKATTTAIKAKIIIADAMVEVAKHFAPMPKPTITQRNGRGEH